MHTLSIFKTFNLLKVAFCLALEINNNLTIQNYNEKDYLIIGIADIPIVLAC